MKSKELFVIPRHMDLSTREINLMERKISKYGLIPGSYHRH